MLQSGYLSKGKTFHFGDTNVKDIRGISPTNVINGEAVCRHIAVMLKDIYNAYGIEGNTLNVFQRDFSERENKGKNILKILNEICEESRKTGIPLIDLIHEYEEELNRYYEYTIPSGDTKTIKTGNHKITTAVYQGNTYYLDPTQSRIYKPSTILEDYLSDTIAARDTKIIPSVNKKVIKTLTHLVHHLVKTKYILMKQN